MSELKGCPHCGGEVTIEEIPPHTHVLATFMPDHKGSFVIECGCGYGIIDDDRENLIKRFNTRPDVVDKEKLIGVIKNELKVWDFCTDYSKQNGDAYTQGRRDAASLIGYKVKSGQLD